MKKIIYLMTTIVVFVCSACDDMLDTQTYTKANTSNYPQTVEHARQVLAGVYNNMNIINAKPQQTFFFASELACDDRLGGGGTGDAIMQAIDLMLNSSENMLHQFWIDRYKGLYRANYAIEKLPDCIGYESDDEKNQMLGEAYFFRGYYLYELASFWENIPLVLSTVSEDMPQAAPEVTWSQIISDLKKAIELMPAIKYTERRGKSYLEEGHVDKWCAEAMMGRAFLFYTGFYEKEEVILPEDQGVVTKDNVISWIDDCIRNSGYDLVPDFRNLWAYTNELTREDYDYTKGKGLVWIEEDGGANNPEAMFKMKFNKLASWSTTIGYRNGYALYFGMRNQDQQNVFPFGKGWGAGPVAPNLWDDWIESEPDDLRREASICDVSAELANYVFGAGSSFVQETGYYAKKSSPISCIKGVDSDGNATYWSTFESAKYPGGWSGGDDNFQLNNIHDMVFVRFADVLLMQSELKNDAEGMNRVRARAGLPAVNYSLEALQNERRWELCFEGTRWNDIRRWHIAEQALEKQTGVKIYYNGLDDVNTAHGGGYAARYRATRGFYKIPEGEIRLSKYLKQNDGWEADAQYGKWK